MMPRLSQLVREPLVHFLLLGALLFGYFEFGGRDTGPDSKRIVVSSAQIEHLAAGFTRTWQRPPTVAELKGLVDDYVREEIAVREARAMGLDQDDTVIRRRLRQKLEFVTQDVIDAAPATVEELERWHREHIEDYTREAQIAFQQVFIDRDRRGSAATHYAERLLEQLRAEPEAAASELGDPTMLPAAMHLSARSEIARNFGEEFAEELMAMEPGRWAGPVSSGFGLHLVRISDTAAAQPLDFGAVAPLVERDYLAARRQQQMDAFYERLLSDYRVLIDFEEPPADDQSSVAATDTSGADGR